MINEFLENLNDGFEQKDSSKIIINLKKLVESNKSNIIYQHHPLGFKFANIGKISAFEEFRVHFWDKNFSVQDEDFVIHDHSFDFDSYIISGEINNIRYEIEEVSQTSGFLYKVIFVDNKSCLNLCSENSEIKLISNEFISSGKFYHVKNTEFHESRNNDEISITLIKMIKPNNFKNPSVYSKKRIVKLPSYKRESLDYQDNLLINNAIIKKCEEQIFT